MHEKGIATTNVPVAVNRASMYHLKEGFVFDIWAGFHNKYLWGSMQYIAGRERVSITGYYLIKPGGIKNNRKNKQRIGVLVTICMKL